MDYYTGVLETKIEQITASRSWGTGSVPPCVHHKTCDAIWHFYKSECHASSDTSGWRTGLSRSWGSRNPWPFIRPRAECLRLHCMDLGCNPLASPTANSRVTHFLIPSELSKTSIGIYFGLSSKVEEYRHGAVCSSRRTLSYTCET